MFYGSPQPSAGSSSLARMAAQSAKAAARAAQSEVADMAHDIERLLMISEALWSILKEKHGYSDNELMRRVAEIDLRDGKLDGKVAKSGPVQCPKCSRTLSPRHNMCIYCGEALVQNPFVR